MGMDPRLLLCIELEDNVYVSGIEGTEEYFVPGTYKDKLVVDAEKHKKYWTYGLPIEGSDLPCLYCIISSYWGGEISKATIDEAYQEALLIVASLSEDDYKIYFTTDYS